MPISDKSKPPGRRARKLKSTRTGYQPQIIHENTADLAAAPSEDDSAKELEGGEADENVQERTQSMDFDNEESKVMSA